MAPKTGATLTSLTVTVISSVSQAGVVALSQTWTVKVYGPGPWVSVGVQVKTPAVVMLAPVGTVPVRVKVRG